MGSHHLSARRAGLVHVVALAAMAALTAGCGASVHGARAVRAAGGAIPRALVRQSRPIGRGAAFHPPARGPVIGPCRRRLGRRSGVHVELFAADRVVLIAPGIGARPPVRRIDGAVVSARCFGALFTRDPTGIVLVRRGARLTIGDLMRSWGQPLGSHQLLSFHGAVTAYVGGRRWTATPVARIPLTRHSEIVLEVGPHVPPHRTFAFPPGT